MMSDYLGLSTNTPLQPGDVSVSPGFILPTPALWIRILFWPTSPPSQESFILPTPALWIRILGWRRLLLLCGGDLVNLMLQLLGHR